MLRLTGLVAALLATTTLFCSHASAQDSANANFGTFYAVNGAVTVPIGDSTPGEFRIQSGADCDTPYGVLELPANWSNVAGHVYSLNVTLSPNSTNGTFSGSCTGTYYNSASQNGSTNYTLTVSYSGNEVVASATAGLKYEVLSILYAPPGNASSNGFSNSISAGASTSATQNFTNNDSISFSAGILGSSNSVTFSTSQSAGSGSSYTTNYQATDSTQLGSVVQAITHSQDQVYLLIDPSITVTQNGPASGFYSFGGSLDATGFGAGGPVPDIINVNIAGLENPTTIPLEVLEPQVVSPGTTLPGLSFICANPLPANQCTQQNACGCTAADFAPIVAQDELSNVTDQATALSSIDPARFVYINSVSLQGPDQQGAGPVKNTYALSDSETASTTTSNGSSYGVSYSHNFGTVGPFSLGISATTGFTFAQTQTAGESNGTAHTGSATFGTSDVGCSEYVDVYEDTTYHTFAFALPQEAPANCQ